MRCLNKNMDLIVNHKTLIISNHAFEKLGCCALCHKAYMSKDDDSKLYIKANSLLINNVNDLKDSFTNYGSLFIGKHCAEVFGDYCSGTNHVLPTNETAKYTGGLSVFDFIKIQTYQELSKEYSNKLSNVTLQQGVGEGYGSFYIKGKTSSSSFRITSPGFSKINIDITYQKDSENIDAKRITLEPEELEAGLLGDLLEQFILEYCEENVVPVVLCTTGLSDEQLAKVKATSEKVAVLKSANMSLGINTLFKLLKEATSVFAPAGFDIEIVEKHHNQKIDAPSGTALALADSVKEALDESYYYKYDRSAEREKRDPKEIGISAVRGGTIVGEHEVIFAGTDEVIEFKHTAYSKSVFAKGAIEAAKYLAGKDAGLYDMSHVIG